MAKAGRASAATVPLPLAARVTTGFTPKEAEMVLSLTMVTWMVSEVRLLTSALLLQPVMWYPVLALATMVTVLSAMTK